jgi:hypothetical protein
MTKATVYRRAAADVDPSKGYPPRHAKRGRDPLSPRLVPSSLLPIRRNWERSRPSHAMEYQPAADNQYVVRRQRIDVHAS